MKIWYTYNNTVGVQCTSVMTIAALIVSGRWAFMYHNPLATTCTLMFAILNRMKTLKNSIFYFILSQNVRGMRTFENFEHTPLCRITGENIDYLVPIGRRDFSLSFSLFCFRRCHKKNIHYYWIVGAYPHTSAHLSANRPRPHDTLNLTRSPLRTGSGLAHTAYATRHRPRVMYNTVILQIRILCSYYPLRSVV